MANIELNMIDVKRLGEIRTDGGIKLFDRGRSYRRIRQSARDVLFLSEIGFTEVMSSNVSAIMEDGKDLLVRFHGGDAYRYFNQGQHFKPMLMSNSKGRYVWQHFRWKQVSYRHEGTITVPSRYASNLEYEHIGDELGEQYNAFNIPIKESSEDILKTLINLYSRHVDINQLELINVLGILKGIYGPNLTS